jgi:outer membrane murein-binding lipoprotein Lpp
MTMPAARSRTALAVTLATFVLAGCSGNAGINSPATTVTAAPSTTAASPSTSTTLSAKAELLAAYNRSWDIYADALRRLDPARLGTAFAGSALKTVQAEVATQKARKQPVRIDVEHNPKILLVTATDGVVADEGINHSVVLDPSTGQPAEQDPDEPFRERRSLKFLGGAWKVVEVIEETGP